MARFVHTADWQIGMKAGHVGPAGTRVREQRLATLRRVVDTALEHQAGFIVVAGDVFEDHAVDRVLVQKVADILASFGGPVYLLPGNHDPLVPGSVWEHFAWRRHANLHILDKEQPVAVGDAVLYPCPLVAKHGLKNPTRWITASGSDQIAIGLAHGTVAGIAQDESDYPIPRDAAERSGLDYLALGHWHSTSVFPASGGVPRMAYSGTHEPTKFGERDSGNVLLVEIPTRGAPPQLTPIRTGVLAWTVLDRPIHDPADVVRTREVIESLASPDRVLLEVVLHGVLDPAAHEELDRIDQLVRARFLYARVDTSQLRPRPGDDRWIDQLPLGVIRTVAERLQQWCDPGCDADRPDYATPDVAAMALMQLARLATEADA